MASRSAREIGFAASAGVDVPADADGPDDVPEDGAAPGACLEPKMADTMLPNTLMMFSYVELPALLTRTLLFFSPRSRQGSRAFDRRNILEPGARRMQSSACCGVVTIAR